MDNRTAFLAGIIRNPKDDLTRLVFADYLEDHGETEYAEFIRTQIELATMPAYEHLKINHGFAEGVSEECQRAYRLRCRAWELSCLKSDWGPVFDVLKGTDWFRKEMDVEIEIGIYRHGHRVAELTYRRGFINKLKLSFTDWTTHADELSWVWKPCGRCEGDERMFLYTPDKKCLVCSGTGKTPPANKCRGECGTCQSGRIYTGMDGTKWIPCGKDIPRPCPPTALPLEQVELTTWPTFEHQIAGGPGLWAHQNRLTGRNKWFTTDNLRGLARENGLPIIVRELLAAEWPGIEFTFTAAEWPGIEFTFTEEALNDAP